MIIKNGSFEQLKDEIQSKQMSTVIFGAGVIGSVTTGEILHDYNVDSSIECYIDNDVLKQGKSIEVYDRRIPICPIDILKKVDTHKTILLVAVSRFSEVIEQIEKIANTSGMLCYIIPAMCILNFKDFSHVKYADKESSPKIPKIIHYMWLGGKDIPKPLSRCIDSWKRYCPDYDLVCWNENNYDVEKVPYMREAMDCKMYGFVPDYARLDILYSYGGIYLDTDVELIKSLDVMLCHDAFCSVEKWQTVNFGGGSGAVKGNRTLKKMLNTRKDIHFINQDGSLNKNTCGYYDTKILMDMGYKLNGMIQMVDDMKVYPYDVFHPYDYMSGRTEITDNTIGIHHFNGGWMDESMKRANDRVKATFDSYFHEDSK